MIHTYPSMGGPVLWHLTPSELGFDALTTVGATRRVGNVVPIFGFDKFVLVVSTTGAGTAGRAELEFTGLAMDGSTLIPRGVVIGGATDITLTAASPTIVTWAWGNVPTAVITAPGTPTFPGAAALETFRFVPKLLVELNITTQDATPDFVSINLYCS